MADDESLDKLREWGVVDIEPRPEPTDPLQEILGQTRNDDDRK